MGPNLNSLLEPTKKKNEKQLLRDICTISLQGLDRLEHIHSKNIVHNRDITPNFLIWLKDPNVIYLIDFGFYRKYRTSRTGKHIKFKISKKIRGSL